MLREFDKVLVLALLDVAIVDNDDWRAFAYLLTEFIIVLLLDLYKVVSFLIAILRGLRVTSNLAVQVEDDALGAGKLTCNC